MTVVLGLDLAYSGPTGWACIDYDDGALDDDQIAHVLGLATQPAGRQRRLRQLLQRRREPR